MGILATVAVACGTGMIHIDSDIDSDSDLTDIFITVLSSVRIGCICDS